jgi:nucleoside-diphosphate-sugar epimerase
MATAVITGAGGMIGRALTGRLIGSGHSVIALVRAGSKPPQQKSDRFTAVECGMSDYEAFNLGLKADIFYHLAWDKTSVAGRDDAETQAHNIQYALDAVKLAERFGCTAFVGAGSQAEYGITDTPLNQNTPVNPQSCYGIAKYSAGSLIMYLINAFINGETPKLTQCRQIWDYLYCGDAAGALEAIGLNGRDGATYCLGGGKGRPLHEYVNNVKDYINKDAAIEFGAKEYYPHQPMYLVADIRDLINDTGFTPATSFKDGIAKTVKWFKEKQNG